MISIHRSLLLLTLGVPLAPQAAAAQNTPEAAALAYGETIRANDWAAAARAMHPVALQQFRQLFEPLFALPGAEELGPTMFGAGSAAEFATLPDSVVFANFLRNVMARQDGLGNVLRSAIVTPLGHVPGGGDTVLVVSRISVTVEGVSITQFEVMPYLLHRGRWLGLLKADFTNMAAMIRDQVGMRDQ